jgi:type II secretory pathway pseudopilin PulG
MQKFFSNKSGMTLVEVVFASALMLIVFGAIFTSFEITTKLIGSSKAHAGALALANQKLEYIRSLQYDDVGTVSGIPNGLIPQTSTVNLNGVAYTERVLIEYVDDPKDGTDTSDENAIVADYKRVKVEYSWVDKGVTKNVSLITNIVPKGIETTAGGGTLIINVFDANVQPVSGASVRIYNNSGSSTIDITRNTNTQGVAMISGAPALANYEITVTDTGYSTDQTYAASSTNPNPVTQHVAVLETEVSTMNFQIDELSQLTVRTIGEPTTDSISDSFDDTSKLIGISSLDVVSGTLQLALSGGLYASTGTVFSTVIEPTPLDSWGILTADGYVPSGTNLKIRVYDATSTTSPVLLPETELPGNSAGFAPSVIALSTVSTTTYPALILGATFSTTDTSTTSSLYSWSVESVTNEPPISNVGFTLTGAKIIGTDATTAPIYKYRKTHTTGSGGSVIIPSLEWDIYSLGLTANTYDIAEACRNIPYVLAPGVTDILKLTLIPKETNTLRVSVITTSGVEIVGASVRLSRGGYDETITTSACGQSFFNDSFTSASNYSLEVSAAGYASVTLPDTVVNGSSVLTVTLSAL